MAPKVTLYGHAGPAPNPIKIMILLEELHVEYAIINKVAGDGPDGIKHPDFIKINPNGRLPALVDHTNDDLIVWESGAILLYIAERFDIEHRFNGITLKERAEVWEWLMFQVSGLGPSQGQVNWFLYQHSVKEPELHASVVERYKNETRRIYSVLERRLEETDGWIALGRFTIVDMANFPWLNGADVSKIDMTEFPRLQAYISRIKALPSVEKMFKKLQLTL